MTLNSRKMPLRPGQPAPRPSVPASPSPRRIRQQYQNWPRAHRAWAQIADDCEPGRR